MSLLLFLLMVSGLFPLMRCWWANRHTTIVQAVHWTMTAWLAWLAAIVVENTANSTAIDPARYLALCLTGCAGIAVLGARRPHVGAWNFVVLGLLAVLVLPLVESLLIRDQPPGALHVTFLGAVLCVCVLNYLPTRLAPAALLLAVALGAEMWLLAGRRWHGPGTEMHEAAQCCLAFTPWLAWWSWRRNPSPAHEFDRLWFDFRDRFGLLWAQRLRDQFNRSAENAGWPVNLSWRGLRRSNRHFAFEAQVGEVAQVPSQAEIVQTLRALLKRFGEVDGA